MKAINAKLLENVNFINNRYKNTSFWHWVGMEGICPLSFQETKGIKNKAQISYSLFAHPYFACFLVFNRIF